MKPRIGITASLGQLDGRRRVHVPAAYVDAVAEAALDAEQKKYAVGKSTTLAVLILQNTLTADRGAEIRSLADYYEALAKLAQQEGSTLERNRINIEIK